MKILHVYKVYHPVIGGIVRHLRLLAEAQVRLGHEVTVLVTNSDWRTTEAHLEGVKVIKAGQLATVLSTPLSPALITRLRSLHPDVVHLHSPYPVGEWACWLAGGNRPYVVSYHADISRLSQRLIMLAYGPLFRRIMRRACAILATSPNFAATSPYLRPVAEKVQIVPLGIDVTHFAPITSRPAGRAVTLAFVGQLRHYKGLDGLLRALALIPGTGRPRLLVAGEGPMRVQWEALTEKLNLRGQVDFLGNVSDTDLPGLYRTADIFVLPSTSRAESFGMVLLEAMASGLPCITTEIGSGNSFVVQHGVTGLVVPPFQPEALAEAVVRLAESPDQREQFGVAGWKRVQCEFTLDKMVSRIEEIYQAVRPLIGPTG